MGYGLVMDENVAKGEFINLCTKENIINSDDLFFNNSFTNPDPSHLTLKWPDFEHND